MTLARSTIKSEVRILGLDVCNRRQTVGAIIRGGLYLDGLLTMGTNTSELGSNIRSSRYYPELRYIMIHQDNGEKFEAQKIQKITRLPVVEIARKKPAEKISSSYTKLLMEGRMIFLRSTLDHTNTLRLLSLSWTTGPLPEPVRVAHLLAKSTSSISSTR